jgi:hypothetical protein
MIDMPKKTAMIFTLILNTITNRLVKIQPKNEAYDNFQGIEPHPI